MPLLDEKALRKPEFEPGVKLMLADGQDWEVPKPALRVYPKFAPDNRTDKQKFMGSERELEIEALAVAINFGANPETRIEYDIRELDDTATDNEWIRIRFQHMYRILRLNYNIGGDEAARLLIIDNKDPVCEKAWANVCRFLTGKVETLTTAGGPETETQPSLEVAEASV